MTTEFTMADSIAAADAYKKLGQLPKEAKLSYEYLTSLIVKTEYGYMADGRSTVCQIFLRNGSSVFGFSQVLSVENNIQEEGNKAAFNDAFNKLWALEGYLVFQKNFEDQTARNVVEITLDPSDPNPEATLNFLIEKYKSERQLLDPVTLRLNTNSHLATFLQLHHHLTSEDVLEDWGQEAAKKHESLPPALQEALKRTYAVGSTAVLANEDSKNLRTFLELYTLANDPSGVKSWKPASQDKFKTLPPDLQKIVASTFEKTDIASVSSNAPSTADHESFRKLVRDVAMQGIEAIALGRLTNLPDAYRYIVDLVNNLRNHGMRNDRVLRTSFSNFEMNILTNNLVGNRETRDQTAWRRQADLIDSEVAELQEHLHIDAHRHLDYRLVADEFMRAFAIVENEVVPWDTLLDARDSVKLFIEKDDQQKSFWASGLAVPTGKIRDDIQDILVTTYGLSHRMGFPADADHELVFHANLSKFDRNEEDAEKTKQKYLAIGVETVMVRDAIDLDGGEHELDGQYIITLSAKDQRGTDGKQYPEGKYLKSVNFKEPVYGAKRATPQLTDAIYAVDEQHDDNTPVPFEGNPDNQEEVTDFLRAHPEREAADGGRLG